MNSVEVKLKKRSPKFFLIIIYFFISLGNASAQKTNLKVITYNIMDGFNFGKDTTRQRKLSKWIKGKQPNVVALQELCGYSDERLKTEALQWDHKFSVLLKNTGYSVGITADRPIKLIERRTEGMWHGMLQVEIDGINFFVIHLSPDDYLIRRRESGIILAKVNSLISNGQECIVLGDFNASSPFDDDLLKDKTLLLNANIAGDAKSDKYKHLANNYFDYSVISMFLSTPMIDVCQKFVPANTRFSYSSPALIPRYRKNLEDVVKKRERLDYIMVSPKLALKCNFANIINNAETDYLSDHYPLEAQFSFSE